MYVWSKGPRIVPWPETRDENSPGAWAYALHGEEICYISIPNILQSTSSYSGQEQILPSRQAQEQLQAREQTRHITEAVDSQPKDHGKLQAEEPTPQTTIATDSQPIVQEQLQAGETTLNITMTGDSEPIDQQQLKAESNMARTKATKDWLSHQNTSPSKNDGSFVPTDPREVLQFMLKRVKVLNLERYGRYLQEYQGQIEDDLIKLLRPEAWDIFQSKDYTPEK